MNTRQSTTPQTQVSQIPIGFNAYAKQALQEKLREMSYSVNPDTIYVNVERDAKILSETLTDTLLKKSTRREILLDDELAGLYSQPTDIQEEQQIEGLDITSVKRCIDILSTTLAHSYLQHITSFWTKENLSVPQELQDKLDDTFLKDLIHHFAIVDKVDQINTAFPNLRQSINFYLSSKLQSVFAINIDPHVVHIDIFSQNESKEILFSFDLIDFTLHCFSSHFRSLYLLTTDNPLIQVRSNQRISNLKVHAILQAADITAIKSTHKRKLDDFWQGYSDIYRLLAKFTYLQALFTQQNGEYKLSLSSLELIFQALGFTQEQLKTTLNSNQIDPRQLSLDILTDQLLPNGVEVSSFSFNNQVSSDILQIRHTTNNNLVLYIPSYTPCFVEAQTEELLTAWVFNQAKQPDKCADLAAHFPLASRLYSNRLDFFLCESYIKSPSSLPISTQIDIFSFLVENHKARISTDLYTDGPIVCLTTLPHSSVNYTAFFTNSTANGPVACTGPFPNHQTINTAFFNPISRTIESLPTLLSNTHTTSKNLFNLIPQPHKTASDFMRTAVKNKWNIDLDPDKTFIGYFLPLDKPIAFEPGETLESRRLSKKRTQTLTEAALSNYRIGFTLFSSTTIVFKDPSRNGLYYPSRSQIVRILPKDIEEIIKNADLDTLHRNNLSTFWNTQADKVKSFVKRRYLQQALEAHQNKTLSEEDLKIVLEVAIHSLSLEENANGSIPALFNTQINTIIVGRCQSSNLFVLQKTGQERVILYVPNSSSSFFSFASYQTCLSFLQDKGKQDTNWQEVLTSHFPLDDQDTVLDYLKKGPFSTRFRATGRAILYHPLQTKVIENDLFTALQKNIQERSYEAADRSIISDRELLLTRMRNITRSIGIALFVPSFAFPILNWVTLTALLTETAVDLYIAKNGDTVNERYQAALDVGLNSIGILLLAFVGFRSLKFSKNQAAITKSTAFQIPQFFRNRSLISVEPFFGTQNSMRVWNISASHRLYSYLDVRVWLLGKKFLLFTGKTNQADHLIISSHGGYFPGTGTVSVPSSTELIVLGPHGWLLEDPKIAKVARQIISPYGVINESAAIPSQTALNPFLFNDTVSVYPKKVDAKVLSGTAVPGHIKNYTLSKYQNFDYGNESYLDIVHVINRSRNTPPIMHEMGIQPVDILTVRNRPGKLNPNLEDLFQELQSQSIQYKKISLVFCRSNILRSQMKSSPVYIPPAIGNG